MRRATTGVAAAVCGCLLWMGNAAANNINTGGSPGVVHCLSAKTLGLTGLSIGGGFLYQTGSTYVDRLEGYDGEPGNPHLFSGNVFVDYGLLEYLDFGVMMPLYYDITGWDRTNAGAGDLEMTLKFGLPVPHDKDLFTQAGYLKVICPTGSDDKGYFPRHAWNSSAHRGQFTADQWLFGGGAAWTLDFAKLRRKAFPLSIHFNAAGVLTQDKDHSVVSAALAFEYQINKQFAVFLEGSTEQRVRHYSDFFWLGNVKNDPVLFTPGVRYSHKSGLWMTLAGDFGMSSERRPAETSWYNHSNTYTTTPVPRYGVQFNLGWARRFKYRDRDGDGIQDRYDDCPDAAEDNDGFQDTDGCPDVDNDGDGLLDSKDKCPNEAGECSGCPEFDRDKDGIPDSLDRCVDEPEDKDGYQDNDGCPDLDNDEDGVPDDKDRCPQEAEDKDGFEDTDGCPDLDNDGDGIPDVNDKCPGQKGVPDNYGCPKTQEIPRNGLILKGVTFASGKAVLMSNSSTILDMVAESLREWTEVRIEIQGHTDSQGNDASNMKLSQARAEAVMNYLIAKGIAPDRMRAKGYGETMPIADNGTAEGREQNRRVELKRID